MKIAEGIKKFLIELFRSGKVCLLAHYCDMIFILRFLMEVPQGKKYFHC